MSFALIYNNRSIKENQKTIKEGQNLEKKTKNIYKDLYMLKKQAKTKNRLQYIEKKIKKTKKQIQYIEKLGKKYENKNVKNFVIKRFKKVYNEENILYLNMLMGSLIRKGHKIRSYNILTDVLFSLKQYKQKPITTLLFTLNKIKPHIVLYNKRRGSTIYELPRLLSLNQERGTAIKWLIKESLKSKKKKSISIFEQIQAILSNRSVIQKQKEKIIETSKVNKPFFYLLKKR